MMILMRHVRKRAKEWDISLKENAKKELKRIEEKYSTNGYKVRFTGTWLSPNGLLAGTSFGKLPIFLNAEWAAYVLLKGNDPSIKAAFLRTVGHKLTHKDNDLRTSSFKRYKNGKKFASWLNEIHADYGAAQKLLNSRQQDLIYALEFNLSKKKEDRATRTHPSWSMRISYAQRFKKFDEKLIKQVAGEADCRDENAIRQAADHFEAICLN